MDEKYIQEVLNGDHNAFRFLIKRYKDIAYTMAMSVVKDEFIAQEVLQMAFVNAFVKLSTFKGHSKFSTWLYRIVINEAFKAMNKQKSEMIAFSASSIITSPETECFSFNINAEEQKFYINEALQKLAPKESLALRLFYLEENSIEEISEMTGWSISNIKVLLHRARTNMKTLLLKHFNVDKQILFA
jgi:RNA polymerase sigma-70 factor (ECF subfamily)